jgi:hypothetical protein
MQKGEDKTMEVRSTQDGILRAFSLLVAQQNRPRQVKPKFTYEQAGSAVKGRNKITRAQRAEMISIVEELTGLDPSKGSGDGERIKELFKQLGKLPVNFVPVKRQVRIDYSKSYPYRSTKRGG